MPASRRMPGGGGRAQLFVAIPSCDHQVSDGKQVLELLAGGHTNLAPDPGMQAAVDALIRSSTTADPGPATFRLGQGVWEVRFYLFSWCISTDLQSKWQCHCNVPLFNFLLHALTRQLQIASARGGPPAHLHDLDLLGQGPARQSEGGRKHQSVDCCCTLCIKPGY